MTEDGDGSHDRPVPVAIGILLKQGFVVVGQRPEGVPLAGYYEFPGGRVEPGETPRQAAIRECREETGLEIDSPVLVHIESHSYQHGPLQLFFFRGEPKTRDAPRPPFRWVPIKQLAELQFPAANARVLRQLLDSSGPATGEMRHMATRMMLSKSEGRLPAEYWSKQWNLPERVTYLNHGSFGPSPHRVQQVRCAWFEQLESHPMDFLARQLEPRLDEALAHLARWIKAPADDLVFVPNATWGMNAVARSMALRAGDEVLLTDHEYGAVQRIWEQRCSEVGAELITARIELPIRSEDEVVSAIMDAATKKTRLIVVSHVTSQTAVIFPVRRICDEARQRGIQVCVDGPHALAMTPLNLAELQCDYYTASCHKWLSAPFGCGFLYVHPDHQRRMQSPVVSWGTSISGRPHSWKDEFQWLGTHDPSSYLAVPAAIEFLEAAGVETFRWQTHALASLAKHRLIDAIGAEPLTDDSHAWYGSMVSVRLPQVPPSDAWPGKPHPLQTRLWQEHRIEVPVFQRGRDVLLRVSCHLYNNPDQVEELVSAVAALV